MTITEEADMLKRIKEITGQKIFSSTRCMKSKEGTLKIEKSKYFRDGTITPEKIDTKKEDRVQFTEITMTQKYQSVFKSAEAKLNSNKAAGSDGIVLEIQAALDGSGIDKITEDRSRSIFTALPKQPSAKDDELLQTISPKNHIK